MWSILVLSVLAGKKFVCLFEPNKGLLTLTMIVGPSKIAKRFDQSIAFYFTLKGTVTSWASANSGIL